MKSVKTYAFVLLAAAASLSVVGCSDDADTDSIESEVDQRTDQAQDELDDLQEEVEQELDEAGETIDEGTARAHAEVFRQRLTELGQDETPSRAVSDLEDIASELPGDPDVSGIEDTDGDGDDDDGKVEITVDDSSACVTVSASTVDVAEGAC
jgi:hypothetical protein